MKKQAIIKLSVLIIIGIFIAVVALIYSNTKKDLPGEIIGKDNAPMVLIPAGEFQMGTNDGLDKEKPAHTVYLDAFYMDRYEVTNGQYRRFVQETGHREPIGMGVIRGKYQDELKLWLYEEFSGDDQPVVCISWEDAKAYAEWAGKRLPTEAEWEKASRGGLIGKIYPWGDDWPPPAGSGNFAGESDKKVYPRFVSIPNYNDGYAHTAPKGSFKPNAYGLYDMAGNVREWCADWYDREYYTKSPKQNPKGPDSGLVRVTRGSWFDNSAPRYLRNTYRRFCAPTASGFKELGFRCALSVNKE
ncbi:SUMF1/EgtB/PvdO family nonheme iron enzyme [Candidatus Poribacteria bacterium]|nr:SUMF1/EgtB/PvdO family nonheme iron enzyme [Candidatus Poribacteria bacterium]